MSGRAIALAAAALAALPASAQAITLTPARPATARFQALADRSLVPTPPERTAFRVTARPCPQIPGGRVPDCVIAGGPGDNRIEVVPDLGKADFYWTLAVIEEQYVPHAHFAHLLGQHRWTHTGSGTFDTAYTVCAMTPPREIPRRRFNAGTHGVFEPINGRHVRRLCRALRRMRALHSTAGD